MIDGKEFEEKYGKLISVNQNYRLIIFEVMRLLEKETGIELQADFKTNFIKYKKEKKMTYEEISSMLSQKGVEVSEDTLKSYSRPDRKGYTSKYSKEIAELFGVKETELVYGENMLSVVWASSVTLKELFERLSVQNQNAVIYLLDALYMEKMAPELFE